MQMAKRFRRAILVFGWRKGIRFEARMMWYRSWPSRVWDRLTRPWRLDWELNYLDGLVHETVDELDELRYRLAEVEDLAEALAARAGSISMWSR